MSVRLKNKESSATLDRVIIACTTQRAQYEAREGRSPSSDDPKYLAEYYETRRSVIGIR